MKHAIVYLGIDVDDKSFTCSGVNLYGTEVLAFKTRPNARDLISKIKGIKALKVKCCYESTYVGFSLARRLRDEGIDCSVIAASKIPNSSSDFVKTDRIDAGKMAFYFSKDLLTEVNIPDQTDESVSHLNRWRKTLQDQLKRSRVKLQSECRTMGLPAIKINSGTETARMMAIRQANEAVFEPHRELLLLQIDYIFKQYEYLAKAEQQIELWANNERYKEKVQALSCLRGIKTLTAMALVSEIGDINRFSHPTKLVSYLGLDIKEYSSGGKEKKYGITKMGSSRLRTAVIESCQILPKSSVALTHLRRRRTDMPTEWVAVAEKHDQRIFIKSRRLLNREKPTNKVKVACARETVGFIWEMLRTVNRKSESGFTTGGAIGDPPDLKRSGSPRNASRGKPSVRKEKFNSKA